MFSACFFLGLGRICSRNRSLKSQLPDLGTFIIDLEYIFALLEGPRGQNPYCCIADLRVKCMKNHLLLVCGGAGLGGICSRNRLLQSQLPDLGAFIIDLGCIFALLRILILYCVFCVFLG